MPNKFFHFSVGSTFGSIFILSIYKARKWLYDHTKWMEWLCKKERWWILYAPYFIMFFGIWAILPDVLFVTGISPGKFGKGLFIANISNIFFFHGLIEGVEDIVPVRIDRFLCWSGELACVLIYGGVIVFYILFIQKIKKSFKKKEQQRV